MGLYTKLPDDMQEVDVIVAGGGTAGCVVAARIADAHPSLSVLIVESGPNNFEDPTIVHPALFAHHIMPGAKTARLYTAQKSEHLAGRAVAVPFAQVLGGGSSINFMTYTRPQRSDFDSWNTPGWTANDMLHYLKKFETYHGDGEEDRHGYSGPVHVSRGTVHGTKAENDFIHAVNKVNAPEIKDLQSLDAINGAQRLLRFIGTDGKRQDAAHRYLHSRLNGGQHPNLHVIVESQVTRVLLENKTAYGVAYRSNPVFGQAEPKERTMRARKLVVVSGGALGTPLILERSGIGDAGLMNRLGIPLVVDLPGVGNGYEDHQLAAYAYRTSLDQEDTMDAVMTGRISIEKLLESNSPLLGYNAQDVTCKFRPTESEVEALGPNFQEAWDRYFKNKPDKPLVLMALINGFPGVEPGLPVGQYLGLTAFSVYPFSRGHVHITGPSPDDPADFDTGFFADTHSLDIKKHVWAYKKQREIMRRMHVYRGEVAAWHPSFSPESQAACVETVAPLPDDVKDIEYTTEDDAAIETYLRGKIATTWHSLGTCKMAPLEANGVVDASLAVHGIQGLKIADLSIVPHNVAANTNSTALAVGEKAADIFIQELANGG